MILKASHVVFFPTKIGILFKKIKGKIKKYIKKKSISENRRIHKVFGTIFVYFWKKHWQGKKFIKWSKQTT